MYGGVTKRDLTSLGGILFMGLIGLLVVMLVQIFLFPGNGVANLVIGALGVLIFTGLTAWDVQRMKAGQIAGLEQGVGIGHGRPRALPRLHQPVPVHAPDLRRQPLTSTVAVSEDELANGSRPPTPATRAVPVPGA